MMPIITLRPRHLVSQHPTAQEEKLLTSLLQLLPQSRSS
jgi:hypothetical protein